MKAWWELYRAYLRTGIAVMIQYRASMFIWMIGRIVEPVIYLVVWSTVARSRGGAVGGFSVPDVAAYYIVLLLVNQFTFSWIMFEYEHRVRTGSFSFMLLRPVHPLHEDLAYNLAYKLITLVVTVPTAVLLVLVFEPAWEMQPWLLVLFLPSLLLGFLLRFLLEWTLAQAAHWTTRTSALNQVYFFALVFLSGRVAPLELFPAPIQTAAQVLPFYWMVAFPTELLLGRLPAEAVWTGLAVQGAYLGLSLGLLALVWRAGVRRYSAVGG